MPLTKMEHFLVLTDDVDETRNFYCDILGMREGYRPDLSFEGCWLYLDEVPVIHVGEKTSYASYKRDPSVAQATSENGTGMLDHVAFNASGYDEIVAKLEGAGLPFRRNEIAEMELRQVFVDDPSGVCIELNFRGPNA